MVAGGEGDVRGNVIVQANSRTMPDWARFHQFVFIMIEHVRSGYLETIIWEGIIDLLLIMEMKPNFLKKHYPGTELVEKIG